MAKAKIKQEYDIPLSGLSNTTVKTASVCVYDISESTTWNGADKAILEALRVYIKTLQNDSYASQSIDFAALAFNHDTKVTVDFTPIKDMKEVPKTKVEGGTDINKAVLDGLNMLDKRKEYYKANNIKFKAGWLYLVTDGQSNEDIAEAASKTNELIKKKQLTMIVIGAGTDIDTTELNRFDDTRPVIFSPNADDLTPLFEWLSHVSIAVGKSMKGEKVTVKPLDNRFEFIG
ncbi:MAG: hypothetical protein DRG78_04860 [Epsilonproteobacteria bacterium]|nr:MAG: hypothetical protein DRG78_04860 [Campylobacterota bacterium]